MTAALTAPKILVLDIELAPNIAHTWQLWDVTVSLNQLIEPARMICWAAKWVGKPAVMFRSEHHDSTEVMVRKVWDLLDEADIVVGYNSTRFDLPHLNREFLSAGLGPPSPYQQIDLLKIARSQFKFPSNKLQYITTALGLPGKTKHEGHDLWVKCLAGDPAAWSRMRNYNKNDVLITEQVYERLRPWIKNHPAIGLWTSNPSGCRNCGSTETEKRGTAYTATASYQQYRCKECGAWSRSPKAIQTVSLRSA